MDHYYYYYYCNSNSCVLPHVSPVSCSSQEELLICVRGTGKLLCTSQRKLKRVPFFVYFGEVWIPFTATIYCNCHNPLAFVQKIVLPRSELVFGTEKCLNFTLHDQQLFDVEGCWTRDVFDLVQSVCSYMVLEHHLQLILELLCPYWVPFKTTPTLEKKHS